MNDALNLPWYVDWTVAACWIVMALLHGQLIARLGHTSERWLRLIGWAGLGCWWLWRIIDRGELAVSAPSVLFVLLLACASLISARKQFRIARADVRCFQDPSHKCYREDRIRGLVE